MYYENCLRLILTSLEASYMLGIFENRTRVFRKARFVVSLDRELDKLQKELDA